MDSLKPVHSPLKPSAITRLTNCPAILPVFLSAAAAGGGDAVDK